MAYEYQTREEFSQLNSILRKGGTRTLVCFCVDVSESMTLILDGQDYKIDHRRDGVSRSADGQVMHAVYAKPGYTLENRISKLNEILQSMLHRMQRNPSLQDGVVISLITFANDADSKNAFLDVGLLDPAKYGNMVIGRRADKTNAGQALQLALQQIEYAQECFSDADVDLRTPTIIFLSDGEPTDTSSRDADLVTLGSGTVRNDANSMAMEIRRQVEQDQLNVVPVLIGDGNAQAVSFMRSMTPDRTYRRMNSERDFEEVFEMIEQTLVHQTMQLVADQRTHLADSVAVEAPAAESVVDTNSTGTLVISDEDMAGVFSMGFGEVTPGAAPEDDFLL